MCPSRLGRRLSAIGLWGRWRVSCLLRRLGCPFHGEVGRLRGIGGRFVFVVCWQSSEILFIAVSEIFTRWDAVNVLWSLYGPLVIALRRAHRLESLAATLVAENSDSMVSDSGKKILGKGFSFENLC